MVTLPSQPVPLDGGLIKKFLAEAETVLSLFKVGIENRHWWNDLKKDA